MDRKRKYEDTEADVGVDDGELDEEAILRIVEQAPEVEDLDLPKLKKAVLNLEKKVTHNQQMRMKFPEQPERFMESELALDEALKSLHMLATAPHLYVEFARLNAVPTLLGLLLHENTDLSIEVVDLLQELTDPESFQEEQANLLFRQLVEQSIFELLVQNIARLDETQAEDAQGVHNTLAIIENMTDVDQELCTRIVEHTPILPWLLGRIRWWEFDSNKLYASEILSILLHTSSENQRVCGATGGIDLLLEAIAAFKSKDPKSREEMEMVENMFDCLCSCLLEPTNLDVFRRAEGFELCLLMMKEKRYARGLALKVLSFALVSVKNCERFVDVMGLKSIFPAFMGKLRYGDKEHPESENEEHVVSCVAYLTCHLTGERKNRLMKKFKESEYEKLDRLVDLYERFLGRVRKSEEELTEDMNNDERFLVRIEGGLHTLQLVCLVLGSIVVLGDELSERVKSVLRMRNMNVQEIVAVLGEYDEYADANECKWKVKEMLAALSVV